MATTTTSSTCSTQPSRPKPLIARRSTLSRRPSLPTSILPTLPRSLVGQSSNLSSTKLLSLIAHLRVLYQRTPSTDSGYTSACSDDEDADDGEDLLDEEEDVDDLGKDDQLERGYTRSFLSGLVKKGEDWIAEADAHGDLEEKQLRIRVLDEAAALVANLAETSASGSLLRNVILPTCAIDAPDPTEPLTIVLNDALPSSLDPTSVGLQSWGSSILLARMIALDPLKFGVARGEDERTLELGAGTGLLSLVWKGMSERLGATSEEVIATDYHEAVLDNLRRNVHSNTPVISPANSPFNSPQLRPTDSSPSSSLILPSLNSSQAQAVVKAYKLDWSAVHSSRVFASTSKSPLALPLPFDKPFHTLLAADVIYGSDHAQWLKSCVEQFLIQPDHYERTRKSSSTKGVGRVLKAPEPFKLDAVKEAMVDVVETDRDDSTPNSRPGLESRSNTTSGSAKEEGPIRKIASPAFHLIVPLRPTHSKAIASIAQVFPNAEDLPPRKQDEWRVAIKQMVELQRVKGVGRADEESYRLYEIGWC